ncbi:MAG: hypothetical protein AOA65_1234 [Candidatus Bathyarchaeota archaeon BA1]|nr:MAG: hypothetical protein AOA65_1234 [Candidatus Bathyarchaeota archaeon BA1]
MGWAIMSSKQLEEAVHQMKLRLAEHIGVQEGMTVVDAGCGAGGFTVCVARLVCESGKVLAVDISDEYLKEFNKNVNKLGVKKQVRFIQADVANLKGVILDNAADMVVSYRFLEELKRPEDLPDIMEEMKRILKKGGKMSIIELSTKTENEAERTYIRLHRDIGGDHFFDERKISHHMKRAGLANVQVETFKPNIWLSPDVAKEDLWEEFREQILAELGPSIDKHGMRYPPLIIVSGYKQA